MTTSKATRSADQRNTAAIVAATINTPDLARNSLPHMAEDDPVQMTSHSTLVQNHPL